MAPSGYKTFSAGAILTATADVQNYLMDQVVSVHDDASARSSAISSPAEGQVSYLKDTNKVYLYNGSAWVEVGGGIEWSGSTANGLGTYSSSSEIVAESTATYDGTTLTLTQSGGGLKMDGLNSSDANTLDDYEEGTWTVTMTASSSGSITMGSGDDLASYIKVGKMVTIFGFVEVTSISSPVGTLKIEGLPFTSGTSAEAAVRAGAAPFMTNMNSTLSPLFYYLGEGVTAMEVNSGSGDTVGNKDTTIADQVTASTQVGLSFTYYSDT